MQEKTKICIYIVCCKVSIHCEFFSIFGHVNNILELTLSSEVLMTCAFTGSPKNFKKKSIFHQKIMQHNYSESNC